MADENVTTPEEGEEPVEETTPKKSLPIKKYGIFAGAVIVIVAAAYFTTLKVVKPMLAGKQAVTSKVEGEASKPKPAEEAKEEKAPDKEKAAKEKEEGSSKHGEGESAEEEPANNIYMVKEIIVNPAGTSGTRFLSTSIGFQLANSEVSKLFEAQEAVVRDVLITILSSRTVPELTDSQQRENLRQQILLQVRKLLGTEEVTAVYFTEFVLQ